MDYLSEEQLYFWKKILLQADKFTDVKQASIFKPFSLLVDEHWMKKLKNTTIVALILDMVYFDPVCAKISNIKILKNYLSVYKKHIEEENQNAQRLGAIYGGHGKPVPTVKADKFSGLITEAIYNKVENDQELALDDLSKIFQYYVHRDDAIVAIVNNLRFDFELYKDKLEKRLNDYLDAFRAGNLVAPEGARYYGAKQQRDTIFKKIDELSEFQGPKNLKITLDDIARVTDDYNRVLARNHEYYRFYETILSLERTGDIKITDLVGEEAIVSLGAQYLKLQKDKLAFVTDFSKFENEFKEHELHWYCPLCGDRIKIFEDKQTLDELLKRGVKQCKNGHENKISIIDDKLCFENEPIQVSKAMAHYKRRNKVKNQQPV